MTIIGHETSAGVDMASPSRTFVVLPWTLRYGDEVRDEAEYFKGIKASLIPSRRSSSPALSRSIRKAGRRYWRADPVEQAPC